MKYNYDPLEFVISRGDKINHGLGTQGIKPMQIYKQRVRTQASSTARLRNSLLFKTFKLQVFNLSLKKKYVTKILLPLDVC